MPGRGVLSYLLVLARNFHFRLVHHQGPLTGGLRIESCPAHYLAFSASTEFEAITLGLGVCGIAGLRMTIPRASDGNVTQTHIPVFNAIQFYSNEYRVEIVLV